MTPAVLPKGDWLDCTPAGDGAGDAGGSPNDVLAVERIHHLAPGPCDMAVEVIVISARQPSPEKSASPEKRAPPKACVAADVKSGHTIRGLPFFPSLSSPAQFNSAL